MKITEILVESQQLDEGPLLNKIGAGIGKAAGTVAKGIGAVAGGVVGAGKALAKGYRAGKTTVGAGGDDTEVEPATDTAAGGASTTPAAKTATAAGGASTTPAAKTATAAGGASPQAPAATTKPAAGAPPAAAPTAAGGTVYAQIKANLDKLDKKGKQRILATLQKEIGSAPTAPAKTPAADPGAGAMGAMAGQLAKGGAAKPNTMANAPVSKTNTAKPGNPNAATPSDEPEAPAAGGGAFKQMAQGLGKKPAAEPTAAAAPATADEPNYNTQTGVASPAQMKKNSEAGKAAAPYGFDTKTGKPNPKPAAEPGATTTSPSGEKVIANPVATVGTKRATNIGEPTFDKETGKPLPGQSINAIRKQAEYGSNTLGKIRKGMKAKAAAPATQESIDADRKRIMGTSKPAKAREQVSESFSLFRKR